jgi:hypothetical protein
VIQYHYTNIGGIVIRDSKQLQIGKAGEYLVCADLILKGFISFPSEQGLPYDVLLDNGEKLLKIQVKTTEKYKTIPQRKTDSKAYIFNIKRAGNKGKTRYQDDEIDIFALVCLDTMSIGYLKNSDMPETINIRVDKLRGEYYDEVGIRDYEKVKELNRTIKNQSEIARKLNMHVSIVNRYLKEGYKPFKTNAKYFSDLKRSKDWFFGI